MSGARSGLERAPPLLMPRVQTLIPIQVQTYFRIEAKPGIKSCGMDVRSDPLLWRAFRVSFVPHPDAVARHTCILARIIHDGSSRNRAVASRDGRVEPRGREAYRGPVALAMQRVNGTWTD